MKRSWLLLMLLAAAGLFGAIPVRAQTPTFRQNARSCSNSQLNSATSIDCELPNATASGSVVAVGMQASTGTTFTVTDDKGNTYTSVADVVGNQHVALFCGVQTTPGARKITGHTASIGGVSILSVEFFNVTNCTTDGTSTGSNTGTSVACGSLTTTAANDLVFQYAVQDTAIGPMTGWTSSSPVALVTTDIINGNQASAYQVKVVAGAVTPAITQAPSNHFDTACAAFKSSSSGTAPSGIRVSTFQSDHSNANDAVPIVIEIPCIGNQLEIISQGTPGFDISSIADTSSNAWTVSAISFNGSSGDAQHSRTGIITCPATTSPLKITLTMVGANTAAGSDYFIVDIVNSGGFDNAVSCNGVDSTAGSHTFNATGCNNAPTTTNGVMLAVVSVDADEVSGSTSGNFTQCEQTPQVGNSFVDENNGSQIAYPSSLSAVQITWTTRSAAVNQWGTWQVFFKGIAAGNPAKPFPRIL
jgi:hypothetical protein